MTSETAAKLLALIDQQNGVCFRCRRRELSICEAGWVERDDDALIVGVLCDWCGWETATDLVARGRWVTGGEYIDRIDRAITLDIADGHTPWRRPGALT